jgi:hypothetical protein
VAIRLAIAAVVLLHLVFIATVVFGGFLVLRRRRFAWVQLPVLLWGAAVNLAGWPCPLTTLENALRARGGLAPYPGSFVAHYLLPAGLTHLGGLHLEVAVGILVLSVNGVVYAYLLLRGRHRRAMSG